MKHYSNLVIWGLIVSIFWLVVLIIHRSFWSRRLCQADKNKYYFQKNYDFLLRWKDNELKGKKITETLNERGYSMIAVYGMGKIGWLLCDQLMEEGMDIAYAIDRDADKLSYNAFTNIPDVRLKTPEEDLEPVDVIIVTALVSFQEIKMNLQKKYSYAIMSIEELLQ